jgi:hypothetical protein
MGGDLMVVVNVIIIGLVFPNYQSGMINRHCQILFTYKNVVAHFKYTIIIYIYIHIKREIYFPLTCYIKILYIFIWVVMIEKK